MSDAHGTPAPALYGLIAEFDDPHDLVRAARKTREAGYTATDAYSPFPVHGIDDALGIVRCKLPYIVLIAALLGGTGGFFLQYWISAVAYPVNIGGRPFFSWPSFIPVTFECTILAAGLTACIGMFAMNGLPQPYHPVFNAEVFERASHDGFFLAIEATDHKFDLAKTRTFLQGLGARSVTEVKE